MRLLQDARDEAGGWPAEATLQRLETWASRQDAVRAVLLRSPFAPSDTPSHPFSPCAVWMEVRDAAAFRRDDGWIARIGRPLAVFYNSLGEREDYPVPLFVARYEDGAEFDFTVVEEGYLEALSGQPTLAEEWAGSYRTLVDKDGRAALLPPSPSGSPLLAPDEKIYSRLVARFLDGAAHVATSLWRGDRLMAKLELDGALRHEGLLRVLDWKHGMETGWPLLPLKRGESLKKRLDSSTYGQFELTHGGAGERAIWEALWATVRLFRRVSNEVAVGLGFACLDDDHRRLAIYLRQVESRAL